MKKTTKLIKQMNTKPLLNRTNGKKVIFNKHKNVVPELIPIHAKEPIKNSFAKRNPKPIEEIPEIIFSFITKQSNICQNDICQNLNINDDDIGRGYCSTKCVIEHSKTLFHQFLMQRKLQSEDSLNFNCDLSVKHKNEPSVNNIDSCNNDPLIESKSLQTSQDLSNVSPNLSLDLPDNFRVIDREPFSPQSSIKSLDFKPVNTIASNQSVTKPQNFNLSNECIEIIDDELEIVEPRESFFSIAHKVIFSNENTKNLENTNKKISCRKELSNSNKNFELDSIKRSVKNHIEKPEKKSPPDVIFVSHQKKRPKIAKQSENFETIVID